MSRAAIAALGAAVALAGCGGGSSDGAEAPAAGETGAAAEPAGPVSVAQAKESGGTGLTIRGFVFVRGENDWVLCNRLEASYPPLCVEPTLKIANPKALAEVKLAEGIGQAGGLQWSERPIAVTGDVSGGALTVSEVAPP